MTDTLGHSLFGLVFRSADMTRDIDIAILSVRLSVTFRY